MKVVENHDDSHISSNTFRYAEPLFIYFHAVYIGNTPRINGIIYKTSPKTKIQSKAGDAQQAISQRYHDDEGDDTAWYASRNEMLYLQVSLSGLRIFHHDGSYMEHINRLVNVILII